MPAGEIFLPASTVELRVTVAFPLLESLKPRREKDSLVRNDLPMFPWGGYVIPRDAIKIHFLWYISACTGCDAWWADDGLSPGSSETSWPPRQQLLSSHSTDKPGQGPGWQGLVWQGMLASGWALK